MKYILNEQDLVHLNAITEALDKVDIKYNLINEGNDRLFELYEENYTVDEIFAIGIVFGQYKTLDYTNRNFALTPMTDAQYHQQQYHQQRKASKSDNSAALGIISLLGMAFKGMLKASKTKERRM